MCHRAHHISTWSQLLKFAGSGSSSLRETGAAPDVPAARLSVGELLWVMQKTRFRLSGRGANRSSTVKMLIRSAAFCGVVVSSSCDDGEHRAVNPPSPFTRPSPVLQNRDMMVQLSLARAKWGTGTVRTFAVGILNSVDAEILSAHHSLTYSLTPLVNRVPLQI